MASLVELVGTRLLHQDILAPMRMLLLPLLPHLPH